MIGLRAYEAGIAARDIASANAGWFALATIVTSGVALGIVIGWRTRPRPHHPSISDFRHFTKQDIARIGQ